MSCSYLAEYWEGGAGERRPPLVVPSFPANESGGYAWVWCFAQHLERKIFLSRLPGAFASSFSVSRSVDA